MRKVDIIRAMLMLLLLAGCGEKEIDACNSDRVKATLLSGTFQKMKSDRIEAAQKQLAVPLSHYEQHNQCFGFGGDPKNYQRCEDSKVLEQKRLFNNERNYATKVIDILTKADAEVLNIRQQSYDKENNVRICMADFKYKNMSDEIGGVHGPACQNTATYKIEPVLDGPGQIYVSWRCS